MKKPMPLKAIRAVLHCALASMLIAIGFHVQPASADPPLPIDRANLSLGVYHADINADARVDGENGAIGSDVNFERDFGLANDRAIGRVRFSFLIGDSQGFEVDAYRLRREGSAVLDRAVSYDGRSYDVDAAVYGRLNLDFASVAYRCWIPAGERDVWGIGLGGGYYRIRGVVEGEATLDGGETEFARVEDSASAWAPLLELGWRHAFSNNMRVYADISGVEKHWGNLTGHIHNANLGLEWYFLQNVGLGLEYGVQRILVNTDRDDFNGRLKLRLDGPSAFLRTRF